MLRSDFHLASSSLVRHALLYPALSADEEHQLAVDGRAGSSSASERIILCNLRLAVSIARDYTGLGLTLEDLEGPRFMRIRHVKKLHDAGMLDSSLRWSGTSAEIAQGQTVHA